MRLSVRETCFSSAAAAATAAGLPTEPVWFEQRRWRQQQQQRQRGRGRLTWGEAEKRKDDKQTRERRNKTPALSPPLLTITTVVITATRGHAGISSRICFPPRSPSETCGNKDGSIASLLLLLHVRQPNFTQHLSTQLGQRLTLWCRGFPVSHK